MSLQLVRARRRLTIAYVGVFALILLAFGSAVLWVATREMVAQLDASLFAAANLLEEALEDIDGGDPGAEVQIGRALEGLRAPGRVFYAFHRTGAALHEHEGPDWLEGFARSVDGAGTYLTVEAPDELEIEWRVYGRRMGSAGRPDELVGVVLADFLEVEDRYPGLVRSFSLAALLALVLVGIGGSYLARKSIAPAELAFGQLRRFTADAAHELRTPVSVIQARSEAALERERVPEEYQAALSGILQETERLSGTLDNLLTLARVDAGDWPVQMEPLFLDDLISDLSGSIGALAQRFDLEAAISVEEECPIEGDTALIKQLIMILIDNAVQYSTAGSEVRISATHRGQRSILEVSDDGVGMSAEVQARVFERFYRADPARAREGGGGAGLGLSIARWIVDVHGATLKLESAERVGTTIRVSFPHPPGQ